MVVSSIPQLRFLKRQKVGNRKIDPSCLIFLNMLAVYLPNSELNVKDFLEYEVKIKILRKKILTLIVKENISIILVLSLWKFIIVKRIVRLEIL